MLTAVPAPAFVALKLHAGGPRDRADLELLATHPDWKEWQRQVASAMPGLPPRIRQRWDRWQPGSGADD